MSDPNTMIPLKSSFIYEDLEVFHPSYGKGWIREYSIDRGYEEVRVYFNSCGMQTLLLKFSQLKVVPPDEAMGLEQSGASEEQKVKAQEELAACAEELFQHAQDGSEGAQELVKSLLRRMSAHAPAFREIYPAFTLNALLYTEARRLHEESPQLKLSHERRSPDPIPGPESNVSLIGGRGGRGAVVTDKEYRGS